MDIKLFVLALTFLFTVLKKIFPKWGKEENISVVVKISEIKKTECMTLDNMANINNHHSRVHFINDKNNNNSSLVFALWKCGDTSSTTSLLLIRTSSN